MIDPLPQAIENLHHSPTIAAVVKRRLLDAPREVKTFFPHVFDAPHFYSTYATPSYFMVFFLNDEDEARLEHYNDKMKRPFPYLIADDATTPAAFGIHGTKNNYFRSNVIKNIPSLWLGKDSTVILVDHTQVITGEDSVFYILKLAYVMSFGDEVTPDTAHEFLDDMIAYSIAQWRARAGVGEPSS